MSTRNIVIAGDTGVGKSSVINLILGETRALVSNDAGAVTPDETRYPATISSHTYYVWDTPGLNGGTQGNAPTKDAAGILRNLLTRLDKTHGVHLLVLCFRGTKVTKMMRQTYRAVTGICAKLLSGVPVVAVITELEKVASSPHGMESWWTDNKDTLTNYKMKFNGHACITTLSDECHPQTPGRYRECQTAIRKLIRDCSLPPKSASAQRINVVLFGEVGAGKSSIINLIAGQEVAPISADAQVCTLDSNLYSFDIGPTRIQIWDTVGLNEADLDVREYFSALEKAIRLMKELDSAGGISLLLFCVNGNRSPKSMQGHYRLFYEVFGRKQVPIALVVTHLEMEQHMEDWWSRNTKALQQHDIVAAGHACVTGLVDHPKYQQSQDAIRALLTQYNEQGKFVMPPPSWFGWFMKSWKALRREDMIHVLTERCHLKPEVAERVAAFWNQVPLDTN